MNWEYISGFFDADGSVCYTRKKKGGNRTSQVSFHNNEEVILKKIQKFIEDETGCRGSIGVKKSEKYSDQYELKYVYSCAIKVLGKMNIQHPKKRHRKNILTKISKLIPRNGQYTEKTISKIHKLYSQYK